MMDHYAYNHNRRDMELMKDVIRNCRPEFYNDFCRFLEGNCMIICNMVIMKRYDFINMVKYIFGILDIFTRRIGNVE